MNNKPFVAALCGAMVTAFALSACGGRQDTSASESTEVPAPPAPSVPRAAPAAVPDSVVVPLAIGEGSQPLRLEAGQEAIGKLVAPHAGRLVAIDVQLGNYFNSSNGVLKLHLCKGQQCVDGSGDLLSSLDNKMFTIVLDQPLEVAGDEGLSFQLLKDGGDKAVAIWAYPSTMGEAQTISLKDGGATMQGRTAKFALHFAK